MPYFSGTVHGLCLEDLLYELIIRNISRARALDNPDKTWCMKVAAVTQAQTRLSIKLNLSKLWRSQISWL